MRIVDITIEFTEQQIAQFVEDMAELPTQYNFNTVTEIAHEGDKIYITVIRKEKSIENSHDTD